MARKHKALTREEVIAKLKALQGERSLREFALSLGVSAAYLSDVYRGNRTVGPKLCAELGISKSREFLVTYSQASA